MDAQLLFESRNSAFYLQKDKGDDEIYLIKVLNEVNPNQAELVHMENEFELTHLLDVPGVRRAIKKATIDNRKAIYLHYFAGETLHKAFVSNRQSLKKFLETAIKITQILSGIHKNSIVHKDINPNNILIDANLKELCLIDFGIATRFMIRSSYQENQGKLEGSIAYISPEQTGRMNRTVDLRSDLYSLGVTFYEMLTGELPFKTLDQLEMIHCHIAQYPVPPHQHNDEIPEILSEIILKLMAKNAEDRYQSAEGLEADLSHCLKVLEKKGDIGLFELGREDYSSLFQLPQKLYGREVELDRLMRDFERVSEGQAALLLVRGSAGVGKSALVHEIHKPITARNGSFIEGKFDQFQRNVPYFAFTQAFESWVDLQLSTSQENIDRWKKRILDAVGNLGGVLTRIIPDLEMIIGPQEQAPDVGPMESQNRFNYIFSGFLKAIALETDPLVVFIDDLQWADGASLDLIKNLIADPELKYFLLIGAYRDNEVQAAHPFRVVLNELEKTKTKLNSIELGNLTKEDISSFISDALNLTTQQVESLALTVEKNTRGNAFFVNEYLKKLYDEELLKFNFSTHRWEWEHKGLDLVTGGDVVKLITGKVQELPEETQEALKLAACIGNKFNIDTLALVFEKSQKETVQALAPAVKEGLISPMGGGYRIIEVGLEPAKGEKIAYVFIHDRIQQSVYSQIPEKEQDAFHFRIGEILLAHTSMAERDSRIFDIVNHLSRGQHLIEGSAERIQLAELNLEAGLKANKSAAYGPALQYFQTALTVLPGDLWKDHYSMALQLFTESAESAFLSGDLTIMDQSAAKVLEKGKNILEKVRVYNILVDAYTAQNRLNDAIDIGLEALSHLGVHFPSKINTPQVILGLMRTKFTLMGKKIPNLAYHRRMEDPYKLEAMPLLERVVPPAYMSGNMLFPLLVFKMVNLSIKYGNSPLSPFGYASYAITLSGVLGDIPSGDRFGKMSIEAMKELNAEAYKVKIYFVNYVFLLHWRDHLKHAVSHLIVAYQSGLKAGNLVGATWAAFYALQWQYFTGVPLGELEKDTAIYASIFEQLKQHAAFRRSAMLKQVILNLMGHSADRIRFTGENYADEEIKTLSSAGDDKTSLFFYDFNKLFLHYLFGLHEQANVHGDSAQQNLESVTGLPDIPFFTFYDALNRFALMRARNGKTRNSLLKTVKRHTKKMKKWARYAPMNYAHKYQLMQGELYRNLGKSAEAEVCYEKAIDGAKMHGYIQEEALARELAGQFFDEEGRQEIAEYYLKQAFKKYLQWGAAVKVESLKEKYPEVFTGMANQEIKGAKEADLMGGSQLTEDLNLDLETVIKASTAFTGEIVLDKLQSKLLEIVMENTGARKGALVLISESDPKIVAINNIEQKDAAHFSPVRVAGSDLLPNMIISYVMRTREPLVIDNAVAEDRFHTDPYIQKNKAKSILCMPLILKGKLQGMIYVENDHTKSAFTKDRIRILNVLSTQIAISIENATLYKNLSDALDQQVTLTDAYSRFTPRAFIDFLGKKSILEVELGDQRFASMTIFFTDIRGYTTISEGLSPEDTFKFVNAFNGRMGPFVHKNKGFINQYLGDAILALFPESAENALTTSIELQKELQAYNEELNAKNIAPLKVGVGMHTGSVIMGITGDKMRMDTAIISDTVNTASRIENLSKYYGANILLSEASLKEIKDPDQFRLRFLGRVQVKGKTKALSIYECFDGDLPAMADKKWKTRSLFEEGLAHYFAKEFPRALLAFEEILQINPDDQASKLYLQKTGQLIAAGVSEDWNGVEVMTAK